MYEFHDASSNGLKQIFYPWIWLMFDQRTSKISYLSSFSIPFLFPMEASLSTYNSVSEYIDLILFQFLPNTMEMKKNSEFDLLLIG